MENYISRSSLELTRIPLRHCFLIYPKKFSIRFIQKPYFGVNEIKSPRPAARYLRVSLDVCAEWFPSWADPCLQAGIMFQGVCTHNPFRQSTFLSAYTQGVHLAFCSQTQDPSVQGNNWFYWALSHCLQGWSGRWHGKYSSAPDIPPLHSRTGCAATVHGVSRVPAPGQAQPALCMQCWWFNPFPRLLWRLACLTVRNHSLHTQTLGDIFDDKVGCCVMMDAYYPGYLGVGHSLCTVKHDFCMLYFAALLSLRTGNFFRDFAVTVFQYDISVLFVSAHGFILHTNNLCCWCSMNLSLDPTLAEILLKSSALI